MKDPAEPFRTKVRLKGAGRDSEQQPADEAPQRPGSLMEALKKARRPQADALPRVAEGAPVAEPNSVAHYDHREAPDSPSHQPRPPRPTRAKVGRLAAAKLRQLQRAREAAAGLESLVRGEIEEAIVEIVPRGRKDDQHRPFHPGQKR